MLFSLHPEQPQQHAGVPFFLALIFLLTKRVTESESQIVKIKIQIIVAIIFIPPLSFYTHFQTLAFFFDFFNCIWIFISV